MEIPRNSLSGQNSRRRASGASSSLASSTILFHKLQKLDREISHAKYAESMGLLGWCPASEYERRVLKVQKLDRKRTIIRNQRKALGAP